MFRRTPRCHPGAIVFVPTTPWGNYGGASEYLWQRSAACLLRQGWAVGVCLHDYGPLPDFLEDLRRAGAFFYFRRPYHLDEENDKEMSAVEKWLIARKWVASPGRRDTMEWIRAQKPALVVVSQCENSDGAWCIGELARGNIPFVTVTHSGGSQLWPSDWHAGQLLSGMTKARVNYFCSDNNRLWMEVQLGAEVPNARIFRNPYQVRFRPECRWPGDGTLKFAMVGRLDARSKAHDLVLKLLARDKWRGRPVVLNIYGDGHHGNGAKNLVKHWNLQQVKFHGYVTDIEEIWSENHYLLQPSRYEGMPCTLVEAMLCGRGAVVTDVGGNVELVENGVSGFVADFPHVDSLDAAMEQCWERRGDVAEIGRAARRRAEACIPENPEMVFSQELIGWAQKK